MFEAYEVALKAVKESAEVLEVIRKRDRDLWDQGYRAAKSVALNIAEGGRRENKDRGYHFRVAAGSAQELKMALDLAVAFRFVTPEAVRSSFALIDRVLALTWRLSHPRK